MEIFRREDHPYQLHDDEKCSEDEYNVYEPEPTCRKNTKVLLVVVLVIATGALSFFAGLSLRKCEYSQQRMLKDQPKDESAVYIFFSIGKIF